MRTNLTVGFVTGSSPDKWASRWREQSREPLILQPVREPDQTLLLQERAVDMLIARGPVDLPAEELFALPLYDERTVAVVSRDHWASLAEELTLADLFDEQLLNAPETVPGWDPSHTTRKPWPVLEPKETIELAAMGSGVYVCAASVVRTYGRRDAAIVPLTDLPTMPVRLLWWRADDDALTQRFVGVVRGRTSNSSRGA